MVYINTQVSCKKGEEDSNHSVVCQRRGGSYCSGKNLWGRGQDRGVAKLGGKPSRSLNCTSGGTSGGPWSGDLGWGMNSSQEEKGGWIYSGIEQRWWVLGIALE